MTDISETGQYFHGCTNGVWQRIESSTLEISPAHTNLRRWLCGYGLYLFVGNPLLAYSFAREKSRWSLWQSAGEDICSDPEMSEPVVLRAHLKLDYAGDKILDLTSPQGMQELYLGHRQLKNLLRLASNPFEGSMSDYEISVMLSAESWGGVPSSKQVEYVAKKLGERSGSLPFDLNKEIACFGLALRNISSKPKFLTEYSIDCMVITDLVYRKSYKAVMAAVQEGKLLHDLHKHKLETPDTIGFTGLRLWDHIEVCPSVLI